MSHFLDPSDAKRAAYMNIARIIVRRLLFSKASPIVVMNVI